MLARQQRQRQLSLVGTHRHGLAIGGDLRDPQRCRQRDGLPPALRAAVTQGETAIHRALAELADMPHGIDGEGAAGCGGWSRHLHIERFTGTRVVEMDPPLILRCFRQRGRQARELHMPLRADAEGPQLRARGIGRKCDGNAVAARQPRLPAQLLLSARQPHHHARLASRSSMPSVSTDSPATSGTSTCNGAAGGAMRSTCVLIPQSRPSSKLRVTCTKGANSLGASAAAAEPAMRRRVNSSEPDSSRPLVTPELSQPLLRTRMARGSCGKFSCTDSALASRPPRTTRCAPGASGNHSVLSDSRAGEHRGSAIHLHRIELPAVTGIRQGHGNLCQCADIERDLQAVAIRVHFRGHDLGTVAAALGRRSEARLQLGQHFRRGVGLRAGRLWLRAQGQRCDQQSLLHWGAAAAAGIPAVSAAD